MTFFSLGVYLFFYLYVRARDAKRLGATSFTPWLWPLVAIFPIAAPSAFRKLFEAYASHLDPPEAKFASEGTSLGGLLFVAMILVTVSERFLDAGSGLVLFGALATVGLLTARTTKRLNHVIVQYSDRWEGEPGSIRPWQWLLLVVVGLAGSLVYVINIYVDVDYLSRDHIAPGETWSHPTHPFEITARDEWAIVSATGDIEKESVLELGVKWGQASVYKYERFSVANVASSRRDEAQESGMDCDESRTMEDDFVLNAKLLCQSPDGELLASYQREAGDLHYELRIDLISDVSNRSENRSKVERLGAGFRLVPPP